MMAKPMKTLQLHYPVIQFLKKLQCLSRDHRRSATAGCLENDSFLHLLSMGSKKLMAEEELNVMAISEFKV